MSPFQKRLSHFIGAPARMDFGPPWLDQQFVWTVQQQIAARRVFLRRRWVYQLGERQAYTVSAHLAMRRDRTRRCISP